MNQIIQYSLKQGQLQHVNLKTRNTECNIQLTSSTLKTNKNQYLFTQHEIILAKQMGIGCRRGRRFKEKN